MIGPSESPRIIPGTGTYYHSVKTKPPTDEDFKSAKAKNRTPRRSSLQDPVYMRQFDGVSVHNTPQQTRDNAEYWGWVMGVYIAELVVPPGTEALYEGPDSRGHGNLYNTSPDQLLRWVTRVFHESEVSKFDGE